MDIEGDPFPSSEIVLGINRAAGQLEIHTEHGLVGREILTKLGSRATKTKFFDRKKVGGLALVGIGYCYF